MKIAIIGSRTFCEGNHYKFMASTIHSFGLDKNGNEFVSGGAKGADFLAKNLAEDASLPFKEFAADWKKYGRAACPKRNRQIIEYCDFVVCFWDGESPGSANAIDIAREMGKPTLIFYF